MNANFKAKSKNEILNGDTVNGLIRNGVLFIDNTDFLTYLRKGGFSRGAVEKSVNTGLGKLIVNQ